MFIFVTPPFTIPENVDGVAPLGAGSGCCGFTPRRLAGALPPLDQSPRSANLLLVTARGLFALTLQVPPSLSIFRLI